jgi:hypothetical protein
VIVAAFPGKQGFGRRREAGKSRPTPKYLAIHAMTAFDFAVLLRTPRLDVAQPRPPPVEP